MPITSVWAQSLQEASFNGVPFVVESDSYSTGRRVAIHEYAFRDTVFAEDLGLNRRTLQITGFLTGDDVFAQRDTLKRACERAGSGPLIHPSLGRLTAVLVGAGFAESAEKGRYVGLSLQFVVVDDKPLWPLNSPDSTSISQGNATELAGATSSDFSSRVSDALRGGPSQISGAIHAAQQFVTVATAPLRDAARLANSMIGVARLVPGLSMGRYIDGNRSRLSNPINSVLAPLNSTIGQANRVASGVIAITNNVTRLDSSVRNAFDLVGTTARFL